MAEPAYTRLEVDERRRRLLEVGEAVFAEHGYADVSMAQLARAAGVSKALLYHYFPSKQAYLAATLEDVAADLIARTQPDESLSPLEQLIGGVRAYVDWIDDHRAAYAQILRSVNQIDEVRELVNGVRNSTADRILGGLAGDDPSPAARTAVRGWLWFMDGACLEWIATDDLDKETLAGLLVGTLVGSLTAAGVALGVPEAA